MRGHAPRRMRLILPVLAAALLGATQLHPPAVAAAAAATIDGSAPVQWDFAPVGGPMGATDTYALTVHLPQPPATYYKPDLPHGAAHAAVLTIVLTWASSSADATLGLAATDSQGNAVGNDTSAVSNDGSDVNVFTVQNPVDDTYTITASNQIGNTTTAVASHAVATLQLVDLTTVHGPAVSQQANRFSDYAIPLSLMPPTLEEQQVTGGRAFGEPSMGVDTRSDTVMYQAGLYTIKATFDDSTKPAKPTFSDVSDSPLTNSASEDAILSVDRGTGRTVVSQLILACSLSAVSDDDGTSWTPAAKACETPPAVDHQTIAAGPFAAPLPNPGVAYPDAMYYCSQNVAEAECALSLDGGMTYGAGVPMWNSDQCFGLHGHIKIAPDGTAYVPNKACGSPECLIATSTAGPGCHPGFAVSANNGATWTIYTIADGHTRYYNTGDPAIGIGAAGTMYYGYGDRDGHPKIVVCTNQGASCSPSTDVGAAFHIVNTEMATVVAGDDNRAAFAFLGSQMPGDDQQNSFTGTWHLYVAVTYDGGKTWTTSDATPNAPVQRGCIEFNASCPSSRGSDDQRNLLDFNDLTIDREGRILAAYTDGCAADLGPPDKHGTCLTDATRLSGLNPEIEGPSIARQSCGLGLYAKFDAQMTPCGGGATVAAGTATVPQTGGSVMGAATGGAPAPASIPNTAAAARLSPGQVLLIFTPALVLYGSVVRRRRGATPRARRGAGARRGH